MNDNSDAIAAHNKDKIEEASLEKDYFQKIVESKAFCEHIKYDLNLIHCNWCWNQCPLAHTWCGRWREVYDFFKKNYNAN